MGRDDGTDLFAPTNKAWSASLISGKMVGDDGWRMALILFSFHEVFHSG